MRAFEDNLENKQYHIKHPSGGEWAGESGLRRGTAGDCELGGGFLLVEGRCSGFLIHEFLQSTYCVLGAVLGRAEKEE